ncbi:MAG: NADPH-dependent FMN reductase [Promethearchaeota archaeon CR_4]|nr:MAG: NADPH-dependent FMN reductase [Candidatus Lokiarchaeota archaeon CR_4]
MKILNVYGSKIKGSSAIIVNRFLEISGKLGAEIESFPLDGANITACKKCLSCKTKSDECIIRDDISKIFTSLVQSDILVLSTGVYVGDVTREMYFLESRVFSFLKPDFETNPDPSQLPSGKKLLFNQVQSAEQDYHIDIYHRYQRLFHMHGFSNIYVIHVHDNAAPDDLFTNDEPMIPAK